MTSGAAIMFVVAAVLGLAGAAMLIRLRAPSITERQTYALRMTGIMLVAAAVVLAFSAAAMWRWSVSP